MLIASDWTDYTVLDAGSYEKLEQWGAFRLIRPDPQVVWERQQNAMWRTAHAHYYRSKSGGGNWKFIQPLPEKWTISYKRLTFNLKPMGFKHTGLFPEQAVNWDYIIDKIQHAGRPIKVLNLFAYTGGATVAAAYAGASVCHVDASKGMVAWAKENARESGLGEAPIRYIVDDVKKFVRREIRRGNIYDAIIMDPPSYGRGPSGEIWKIEDELFALLELCMQVLSNEPLFFILNSYTTGLGCCVMENLLKLTLKKQFGGSCIAEEIGLPIQNSNLILPCGSTGRWER